ncbi:MAG: restriction endonuclease subunit S, partial [Verrucomicrobia bacterium]|nr:restriction endonuclease subunit S [Verrucomicrobiota bacterium]
VATTQNAYVKLRRFLVEDSLVAVVSLPAGVFKPYSGVKTSILLLDKKLARQTKEILFLKITADGFDLGDKRNPIAANDLPETERVVKAWLKGMTNDEGRMTNGGVVWKAVEKSAVLATRDATLVAERFLGVAENDSEHHPMIPLGDEELFRLESGGTPSTTKPEFWDGPHAWATLVDLHAKDLVTNLTKTVRTITDAGRKNSSAVLLPVGSVIVSTRATLGRVAVARIPVATNQGFKNIIIKDAARALPEYVALAVTRLRAQMLEFASGGTFKEISKANFALLEIPLPPLEEQRRIVAEIEGYQKVLDGARQILAGYKPKLETNADWPVTTIGEVARVVSGHGFPLDQQGLTEGGIPFYKVSDMNLPGNERFMVSHNNAVSRETLAKLRAKSHPAGTIIFPKIGAAIATNKKRMLTCEATFDNNVMGIVPGPEIEPKFLFGWLMDFNLSQWASEAHPPSMRQPTVEEQEIPLPPLEEQRRLVAELDAEAAQMDSVRSLLPRFEAKIQRVLDRVWGTEATA